MLRSPLEKIVAGLVVVVGLLVGALIALTTRPGAHSSATPVAVTAPAPASAVATPAAAVPAAASPVARTAAPATAAATTAAATAAPATIAPAATNAVATIAAATSAGSPAAAPSPVAAHTVAMRPGAWRIAETGTSVGTIVWSGTVTPASGGQMALDVRKASVAGHGVGPCERSTHLRAVLQSSAPQLLPFQETNCSGAVINGEMHVQTIAARTMSGSFWSGGVRLGTFRASAVEP